MSDALFRRGSRAALIGVKRRETDKFLKSQLSPTGEARRVRAHIFEASICT
jgi:hypothetical protein